MTRQLVFLLALTACGLPDPEPVPAGTIAFAVFGDGPYFGWEEDRFDRLLGDVARHHPAFLIHVGDILDRPCSDGQYRNRLGRLNTLPLPVIYTPGDNEWTDCHEVRRGSYDPLERLATLRRTFFADPTRSLGGTSIPLTSQAGDGFPENARWTAGRVVFATVHMVGSDNGLREHGSYRPALRDEVAARTRAALAWLDSAFVVADATGAAAVVLAFHGDPGLARGTDRQDGYDEFGNAIEDHAKAFSGEVLVIHGDWHEYHVDHPLRDRETGDVIRNVTRLETFGSPDIGWVRVVVDTAAGQFVRFEPRVMPRRWGLF